jgi:hypothetical protein
MLEDPILPRNFKNPDDLFLVASLGQIVGTVSAAFDGRRGWTTTWGLARIPLPGWLLLI